MVFLSCLISIYATQSSISQLPQSSFTPPPPPSQGTVTYQLLGEGVSWSSVFRLLESNKERLGIIDYSVSQTTLEQVRQWLNTYARHAANILMQVEYITAQPQSMFPHSMLYKEAWSN